MKVLVIKLFRATFRNSHIFEFMSEIHQFKQLTH